MGNRSSGMASTDPWMLFGWEADRAKWAEIHAKARGRAPSAKAKASRPWANLQDTSDYPRARYQRRRAE